MYLSDLDQNETESGELALRAASNEDPIFCYFTKDPEKMCGATANYYEEIFKEPSNIYHLHPYTDAPGVVWENYDEKIPVATLDGVLNVVQICKKKKSPDTHDLSKFVFSFFPTAYWSLLLKIFNLSLSRTMVRDKWKETRMLLVAKKDSVCSPSLTRPVSLLDIFLKTN